MSDLIEIPFDGKAGDNAVLLLAAAEELGLDSSVVATKTGAFLVPEEVAKKAGLGETKAEPKKSTAKKAPAKKSTAKAAAKNK